MASYANGRFPLSLFEHLGGNIYLPPATAARFRGFRADVKAETGVTLRITGDIDGLGGWNGYRPFDAQVRYKKHYGNKAAEEGKSSHGGKYRGSDFFAFDIANSGDIPWSTFVRLAKKWGLMTDFVSPRERWHVGDPNPWSMPAASGSNESEEDDMTPEQDARLRNIENLLAGGGPSLRDPNWHAATGTVLDHLQNLTGFVWSGGPSAADPNYLGGDGSVYNMLKAPIIRTDGAVPPRQDNADTGTMVRELLARPAAAVSDAQVKAIADAVAKQIGKPTVTLDYAAIAKAVNDESAKRLAA